MSNATFKRKFVRATRRFIAHKLAYVGVRLDNLAWKIDFDTEFEVFMRDHKS